MARGGKSAALVLAANLERGRRELTRASACGREVITVSPRQRRQLARLRVRRVSSVQRELSWVPLVARVGCAPAVVRVSCLSLSLVSVVQLARWPKKLRGHDGRARNYVYTGLMSM